MRMIVLILFFYGFNVSAHEAGETQAEIGPGKAVEAYDEHDGLKLSEKAKINLGIKTIPAPSSKTVRLKKESVVEIRDEAGIYILRSNWFQFVAVTLSKTKGGEFLVETKELKPTDEIVVKGVALLRVAHINLISSEPEEHEESEKHEHADKDEKGEEHEKHEDHTDEHEGERK